MGILPIDDGITQLSTLCWMVDNFFLSMMGLSPLSQIFFVSAPKCRDVVLGSYVRTGYVISSTRAQCEQLKKID